MLPYHSLEKLDHETQQLIMVMIVAFLVSDVQDKVEIKLAIEAFLNLATDSFSLKNLVDDLDKIRAISDSKTKLKSIEYHLLFMANFLEFDQDNAPEHLVEKHNFIIKNEVIGSALTFIDEFQNTTPRTCVISLRILYQLIKRGNALAKSIAEALVLKCLNFNNLEIQFEIKRVQSLLDANHQNPPTSCGIYDKLFEYYNYVFSAN